MQDYISKYRSAGFTEDVGAASMVGSTVLKNPISNQVVKIGYDKPYAKFVRLVKDLQRPEFPKIFSHEEDDDDSLFVTHFWTSVTVMEVLRDLTPEEGASVMSWCDFVLSARKRGVPWSDILNDPFELLEALEIVWSDVPSGITGFDIKASNFMARDGDGKVQIVITDPYN